MQRMGVTDAINDGQRASIGCGSFLNEEMSGRSVTGGVGDFHGAEREMSLSSAGMPTVPDKEFNRRG